MLHSDAVLDKAQQLKARGVPFVLATVVRSESPTSAKPGAKALVSAEGELSGWIGGGCAQPAVLDTAKKALADGQPRLIRVSPGKGGQVEAGIIDFGMTCHSGGTLDIFIDPVIPRPALLIVGASPVAQALSEQAQLAGFDVHAAFPGADADMFPRAVQIIDGLELGQLQCGVPPLVVVATQGKRDEAGLEAALHTGAPYIAFVASARKADKLRGQLRERGLDAAAVDAIVSPAGIEIGAVTPEEIAVSVLAGLIQARRSVAAAPTAAAEESTGSCCGGDAEQAEAEQASAGSCCGGGDDPAAAVASPAIPVIGSCCGGNAAQAIDPVCGMSVQIEGARFVSQFNGEDYYFCCDGCRQAFDKDPQAYLAGKAAR